MGNQNSSEDTLRYRAGYPDKIDNRELGENLKFYQNKRASVPTGDFIDKIHAPVEVGGWFGDFELLERHHGYIQWLFPIREEGMNMSAQELQLHEAEAVKADPKCRARVVKSYQLMLHFYGMELANKETGEIKRASHWQARYRHLDNSFHNYLRITRILKSLGELGYEHYKWPFLRFVLTEIYENRQLLNAKRSCLQFWSEVLRNVDEQNEMRRIVREYDLPKVEQNTADDSDDNDDDDDDDTNPTPANPNTRGQANSVPVRKPLDDDINFDDDDTIEMADAIDDDEPTTASAADSSNKQAKRRVKKSQAE